jgi:hypothetical protein
MIGLRTGNHQLKFSERRPRRHLRLGVHPIANTRRGILLGVRRTIRDVASGRWNGIKRRRSDAFSIFHTKIYLPVYVCRTSPDSRCHRLIHPIDQRRVYPPPLPFVRIHCLGRMPLISVDTGMYVVTSMSLGRTWRVPAARIETRNSLLPKQSCIYETLWDKQHRAILTGNISETFLEMIGHCCR